MHTEQTAQDGRHAFDFLTGTWQVHNRRLRERLKGSQAWEEFESLSVAQTILGGLGNFDALTLHRESGVTYGSTLRLFNPETQQWSLYWSDSATGSLYAPMVGSFVDGVGYFYACELFERKTIISRFLWSGISATTWRWEQAFSTDGGATWETNWIMEGVKISE
ncbi:MAG: hypothetical protein KC519_23165 [Anaerolineae bacterium]|nr:hypothetical protein [Anaerolineae bacterium]